MCSSLGTQMVDSRNEEVRLRAGRPPILHPHRGSSLLLQNEPPPSHLRVSASLSSTIR